MWLPIYYKKEIQEVQEEYNASCSVSNLISEFNMRIF